MNWLNTLLLFIHEEVPVAEEVVEVVEAKGYPIAMWLNKWLYSLGLGDDGVKYWKLVIVFLSAVLISAFIWWVTRRLLLAIVARVVKKSKTTWDDRLLENRFFAKMAHIFPAIFFGVATPYVFADFPKMINDMVNVTEAFIVGAVMFALGAFLNALQQILSDYPNLRDKPLGSYVQLAKIVVYFLCVILMISLVADKSPLYFLSAMGAMTAILLLVFKDTILGFVASIQLAANDMVRVGDWVTMERFGADGDIIEINLATVKVRNFDRTITTIPTYAFISDSFKNWRGMQESDGRRIKRSVSITASSIQFCDDAMLERFKQYVILKDYIEKKQSEIKAHNEEQGVDQSVDINGRRLTNIGLFREYLSRYLEQNPNINHEMTCMVRQLPPTETGLPIELYAFSASKDWGKYEEIMADIFDHILAAVPGFELEVFQNPTGADFASISDR